MLHRREAIPCHIRSLMVIEPLPLCDILLQLTQRLRFLTFKPLSRFYPHIQIDAVDSFVALGEAFYIA
ncbi:hypothetical protein D3C81_20150 [compost metagenome]|nr:hypothetical protein SOD10_39850 [Serratia plymuthica]CAI0924304.1 Uncharacterised protein [Serratia plymuthica]